jgi:hypothetical protein
MNFYDQYKPGTLAWVRSSNRDAKCQIGFVVRKITDKDRSHWGAFYGDFVVVLVGERLDAYGEGWIFPLETFSLEKKEN